MKIPLTISLISIFALYFQKIFDIDFIIYTFTSHSYLQLYIAASSTVIGDVTHSVAQRTFNTNV